MQPEKKHSHSRFRSNCLLTSSFLLLLFLWIAPASAVPAEPLLDPEVTLDTLNYMAYHDDASNLSIQIVNSTLATGHYEYLDLYKYAVVQADTFTFLAQPRYVFKTINKEQSMMLIQQMATNSDASTMQDWQLVDVGIIGVNPDFIDAYRTDVAAASGIENPEALQALIDETNHQEALPVIAAMATGNDASMLSVLLLQNAGAAPVSGVLLSEYASAVAAADNFTDISQIQDLVTSINNSLAFPRIQQMATESDASLLENALKQAAGTNRTQELYIPYYRPTIEARSSIADKAELQAIVDSINPIAAFAVIQEMNRTGNSDDLNTTILKDAGANGVNTLFPQALDIYKVSIYTADSIPDLATLQKAVDISNQWFEFIIWILFQDTQNLTIEKLELVGAEDLVAEYLPYYKYYMLSVDYNTFPAGLQSYVIERGNTLGMVADMATNGDASLLTYAMLEFIGAAGIDPDNVAYYQDYIAGAGTIESIEDLEAVIKQANNFATIMDMIDAGDVSGITITLLKNAGVQNTESDRLDLYKDAIAAAEDISTLADLQAIIDEMNAVGIDNNKPGIAGVNVYPNPATEFITVSLESRVFSIDVMDIRGSVVYHVENCSNKEIIPVGSLENELLMIRVTSGKESRTIPVIVN